MGKSIQHTDVKNIEGCGHEGQNKEQYGSENMLTHKTVNGLQHGSERAETDNIQNAKLLIIRQDLETCD